MASRKRLQDVANAAQTLRTAQQAGDPDQVTMAQTALDEALNLLSDGKPTIAVAEVAELVREAVVKAVPKSWHVDPVVNTFPSMVGVVPVAGSAVTAQVAYDILVYAPDEDGRLEQVTVRILDL